MAAAFSLPPKGEGAKEPCHLRGFTLIELLVVFAIMALIIAIVPIAYERMREGAQYRDAVRALVSSLRDARVSAMEQGREQRFFIDLRQRTYGLQGQAPQALPADLNYRAVVASKELTDQLAAIAFLPDGGATGGSIDILRANVGGVRLRVDWLSGRVTQEPLAP